MTVCISALCASTDGAAKNIAVISDRMVTLGRLTEFEHEVPKISKLTDRSVALIAGDALRGSQLVKNVVEAGVAPPLVRDLAQLTAVKYAEMRDAQIEAEIFRPRGLTRLQFYQGGAPALGQQPQIFFGIDNQVATFNFNVEVIVTGIDEHGGHIFYVGNPGQTLSSFHQIGYHAIGSGALQALQSLIGFGHMSGRSLHQTIFACYASKRRAEVAPGVGKDTDLAILSKEGMFKADKKDLDELEQIFQEYQKPASEVLMKKAEEISNRIVST
jgi:20S proteasome alpha/beta subunit